MPTPTFPLDFEKVGIGILVIDFQGNIFMSSAGFQNLVKTFLFNLRHHSTLYDLPFQSYDHRKRSKNVTVCQSYMDKLKILLISQSFSFSISNRSSLTFDRYFEEIFLFCSPSLFLVGYQQEKHKLVERKLLWCFGNSSSSISLSF
jgi:hypothetical protein